MEEPKVKELNEELRAELEAYRERNNLSLAELAIQLGSNASQVSRYLAKKPIGDVEKLERIIRDVLKHEDRRKAVKHGLFETPVSKAVAGVLDTIKETNDVGLIFSSAGEGKTSGIEMYCLDHPATIALTATQWACGASAIERLLWDAVNTESWSGNTKRSLYLVSHLRGSNRLLIIDNSHRLDGSALRYLFDFSDSTSCPLALVGNPEVLDKIRTNDQMFSRVGIKRELRLEAKQMKSVVRRLLDVLYPSAADELLPMALIVAEHKGRLRAVRKQVQLMQTMLERAERKGDKLAAPEAFLAAHEHLVRDYALKEVA